MAHTSLVARFFLALVPALALGTGALGCAAHVKSEGAGEGAGGGDTTETSGDTTETSGDTTETSTTGGTSKDAGGASKDPEPADCKAFTGAGCKPGETATVSCWQVDGPEGAGHHYDATRVCQLVTGCATQWSDACWTPLVLSFDGAEVDYQADAAHSFDINGASSQITDWPTARTPWLALDRDGSGVIEDGSELFGSMSPLRDGGRAGNGFVALRELDDNGDGRITAEDSSFSRLSVWRDRDGDRRSGAGELASAGSSEIVSIDLDYVSAPACDARGNCGVERAAFTFRDAAGVLRKGTVIDVHLRAQR